jgi:hypothetical protein
MASPNTCLRKLLFCFIGVFKFSVLNRLVRCDYSMSCPQLVNGENGLRIRNVAVNVFGKKLQIVLQPMGMEEAYIWPWFLIGSCVRSKEPSGSISQGISSPDMQSSVSQDGLCCMESVCLSAEY